MTALELATVQLPLVGAAGGALALGGRFALFLKRSFSYFNLFMSCLSLYDEGVRARWREVASLD